MTVVNDPAWITATDRGSEMRLILNTLHLRVNRLRWGSGCMLHPRDQRWEMICECRRSCNLPNGFYVVSFTVQIINGPFSFKHAPRTFRGATNVFLWPVKYLYAIVFLHYMFAFPCFQYEHIVHGRQVMDLHRNVPWNWKRMASSPTLMTTSVIR